MFYIGGVLVRLLSEEIIQGNKDVLDEALKLFDFSQGSSKSIFELIELPQSESAEFNRAIEQMITPRVKSNATAMEVMDTVDILHSYMTGLHFYVDTERVTKLDTLSTNINILDKVQGFEDIIIDFTEPKVSVRVSKNRYQLLLAGNYEVVWSFAITVKESKGIFKTSQFFLVPNKYPRLFVDASKTCSRCSKCFVKKYKVKELGVEVDSNFVLVGSKKREGSDCILDLECRELTSQQEETFSKYLSFDDVVSYCAYCISAYLSRNKIKKNRLKSEGINIRKVSSAKEIDKGSKDSVRFIPLSEYSSYERREKKEWQGGHHSSPCKHIRAGYYRHYKSGKVVWVESTTVNLGKGKAIYEVK